MTDTENETDYDDETTDFDAYFNMTELETQQDFRWMMEILRDGYIYGGDSFTNVPDYTSIRVERLDYDEAQSGLAYLPIAPGYVPNGGGFGGSGRNFEVDNGDKLHEVMDCCINENQWDGDIYEIEIDGYQNQEGGKFYRIELANTFMYVALEGNEMIENYDEDEIDYSTGFQNYLSNEYRDAWDSALSIIAEWWATQDRAVIRAREDGVINNERNREKVRKIFRYGIRKAYEKKLADNNNEITGNRVRAGELDKDELMEGLEEITEGNEYMELYLSTARNQDPAALRWDRIYTAFNRLQSGDAPADGDILDYLKEDIEGEGGRETEETGGEEEDVEERENPRTLFPDGDSDFIRPYTEEDREADERRDRERSRPGGEYDEREIREIWEQRNDYEPRMPNMTLRGAARLYLREIRQSGRPHALPGENPADITMEDFEGILPPQQRIQSPVRRTRRPEAEDAAADPMGARQDRMRGQGRAEPRRRRCPNGTRRNRTTGECEPVNRPAPSVSARPNMVDEIILRTLERGGEEAAALRRNLGIREPSPPPQDWRNLPPVMVGEGRTTTSDYYGRREPSPPPAGMRWGYVGGVYQPLPTDERTRANLERFNALNLGD